MRVRVLLFESAVLDVQAECVEMNVVVKRV